jgi:ATP-dependent helicase/nuclease subunit A
VLVQGVIDLVIVNNDGAMIVDFKTNKTHNEKYLIDQYGLQLKMYALAFEKAYKIKVNKKMLYSFEMAKFIEV